MTRAHGLSGFPRALCRVGVLVGVACAALVSASCHGRDETTPAPTTSPARVQPPGDPSDNSQATREYESVRLAYREFVDVLGRAASLPRATRKERLSKYMVDPQLSKVLDAIQTNEANDITTYGSSMPHIKSVRINGDEATVDDCQDGSKAGLIEVSTSKKINRGLKEENIKTDLMKSVDGRWRVSNSTTIGEGC
jgi:hypothetical protein